MRNFEVIRFEMNAYLEATNRYSLHCLLCPDRARRCVARSIAHVNVSSDTTVHRIRGIANTRAAWDCIESSVLVVLVYCLQRSTSQVIKKDEVHSFNKCANERTPCIRNYAKGMGYAAHEIQHDWVSHVINSNSPSFSNSSNSSKKLSKTVCISVPFSRDTRPMVSHCARISVGVKARPSAC